MADTAGIIINPPVIFSTIDPFDFPGVVAPFTLFDDIVPPTVTLVSPLGGRLERLTPVVFQVVDNFELGVHAITVEYPDVAGLYEVAWDGELIGANLSSLTRGAYDVTRTVVPATASNAAGWEYTVLRRKGWLSRPIIRVRAADKRGNVV